MTGPEHYREAERLLDVAPRVPEIVAAAQVHATLALAAASAYPASRAHLTEVESKSDPWTSTQATS